MSLPNDIDDPKPVHKSAQRLRWFVGAFEDQVNRTEVETGNQFAIDRTLLTRVFSDWIKAFEAQNPTDPDDKMAYVGFAAGLMLRTLIEKNPVSLTEKPKDADETNPAYFWPEGYLYVAFCLNVRGLVLETDFRAEQHTSEALQETRTWWSFRENVQQDPSLAIAFLDLFAGDEPEWSMPDLFRGGRTYEIAQKFYSSQKLTADE